MWIRHLVLSLWNPDRRTDQKKDGPNPRRTQDPMRVWEGIKVCIQRLFQFQLTTRTQRLTVEPLINVLTMLKDVCHVLINLSPQGSWYFVLFSAFLTGRFKKITFCILHLLLVWCTIHTTKQTTDGMEEWKVHSVCKVDPDHSIHDEDWKVEINTRPIWSAQRLPERCQSRLFISVVAREDD